MLWCSMLSRATSWLPWLWGDRTRPRARGGGGDRRALGRGPGADPMV